MNAHDDLVCPCGAPAPRPLPRPGTRPARCADCDIPLVAPGGVARGDIERGLGAALLVASFAAVGWMFAVRGTGGDMHELLPIAGALLGLSAVAGARARGPAIQWSAGAAFVAFLVLGEVLIFRGALLPRLTTLHQAEGASDAQALARQEIQAMAPAGYLQVELNMSLFLGFAAGLLLAVVVTRAPPAVEAFRSRPAPQPADAPEPLPPELPDDDDDGGIPCP